MPTTLEIKMTNTQTTPDSRLTSPRDNRAKAVPVFLFFHKLMRRVYPCCSNNKTKKIITQTTMKTPEINIQKKFDYESSSDSYSNAYYTRIDVRSSRLNSANQGHIQEFGSDSNHTSKISPWNVWPPCSC